MIYESTRYLSIYWCVLILWNEYLVFYFRIRGCHAPGAVVIIADPQLVDEHSYYRRGLLLRLSQFYTDLYMRRNYRLLSAYYSPLHVFLGDLTDGGRQWQDLKWFQEYERFKRVFPQRHPRWFSVGNHDIGFGNEINIAARNKFERYFGETNQELRLENITLTFVDTLSLSATNDVRNKSVAFLDNLEPTARILFTHVPLYHEGHSCGPLREAPHGILNLRGPQYQNLLDQTLSTSLLSLHPLLVFSGDDHDYCDYTHETPGGHVREITVKSFSWAMGVRNPGYQLLTLPSLETHPCILPSQLHLFLVYGVSLAFTILILIMSSRRRRRLSTSLPTYGQAEYDRLWKPAPKQNPWLRKRDFFFRLGRIVGIAIPLYLVLLVYWN